MAEHQEKSIVVVACKGSSVLLNIGTQTLDIDCYQPINLSKMFPKDVLDRCASLSAHLREGNLVYYEEGSELPKDSNKVSIKSLQQVEATHISAQFEQSERDTNRTHSEIKTRADITDETRKLIQDQVEANKKPLFQQNQKLVKKVKQTVHEIDAPMEQPKATIPSKSLLKVSMDVSPEAFAKKMATAKEKIEATEQANETSADAEASAEVEIARRAAEQTN